MAPRSTPRFLRQALTGGDACEAGGAAADAPGPQRRSTELLLGCAPEGGGEAFLLALEPAPCRYALALYHPLLCQLWRTGGGAAARGDRPQRVRLLQTLKTSVEPSSSRHLGV